MAVRGVAALAALALAVVLGGCDRQEGATDDALVDAGPASVDGKATRVQLPTGRLSVTVGEPVTTIPAEESYEPGPSREIEADDGEVFLPIELDETLGVGVPSVVYQSATRDDPIEAEVSLRVGDDDVALGAFDELGSQPFYARVPEGDPSAYTVVVSFDGVEQTVSADGVVDPGEAAGLYDLPAEFPSRACRGTWTVSPEATKAPVECVYLVGHYPYLSALGWAQQEEPGATWAFVATNTTLGSVDFADGGSCDAAGLEGAGTTTLDGAEPASEILELNNPATAGGSFVSSSQAFLVAASDTEHDLTIMRMYSCRDGADLTEVRLSTRITVDAA